MSRDIDSTLKTAVEQDTAAPIILAKLEYDSGDINVHSGIGSLVYNGDTYLGIGQFGSISGTAETSDGSVNFIDLRISGVESALISTQLSEYYQGRQATIRLGAFNLTTNALITPTIIFRGIMDNSTISLGSTGTITLRVNNRLANWDRTNVRRYTDADQRKEFNGDLGFEFVQQIREQNLIWGSA